MNIFIKILFSLFGSEKDEFVQDETVYVYTDIQDHFSVKEGSPMPLITKKQIFKRYKSIYRKKENKKKLFGFTFCKKIYLFEIEKIPFLKLKEKFIKYKRKQKTFFSLGKSENEKIIFI